MKYLKAIIIFLLVAFPVQAENCVVIGGESELVKLINQIFTWSLRIAGLVVFAALIFGGFTYLTSGGNQSKVEKGKSYMTGAIIGLVVLLGSVVILQTINPQILTTKDLHTPPDHGVCFYSAESSGGTSTRCCYTESSKSMPEDFEAEKIRFNNIRKDLAGAYLFSTTSWEQNCNYELNDHREGEDPSKQDLNISPRSFYLDWNKLGVYLYQGTSTGYSSRCNMSNFPESPYQRHKSKTSDLGNYKNKVKAVNFRNLGCVEKEPNKWYPKVGYVAVLHERTEFRGTCSIVGVKEDFIAGNVSFCNDRKVDDLAVENFSGNPVYAVEYNSSSIIPLNYKFSGPETGKVTFYEKGFQKGPRFSIEAANFQEDQNYFWNSDIEYPIEDGDELNDTTIEIEDPEGNATTVDRIMSIKIDGNFAVLVGKDSSFGEYGPDERSRFSFGENCETLTDDVDSFVGSSVHTTNDPFLNSIGIAPLKSSHQ